jgi:hypothetical protein
MANDPVTFFNVQSKLLPVLIRSANLVRKEMVITNAMRKKTGDNLPAIKLFAASLKIEFFVFSLVVLLIGGLFANIKIFSEMAKVKPKKMLAICLSALRDVTGRLYSIFSFYK